MMRPIDLIRQQMKKEHTKGSTLAHTRFIDTQSTHFPQIPSVCDKIEQGKPHQKQISDIYIPDSHSMISIDEIEWSVVEISKQMIILL